MIKDQMSRLMSGLQDWQGIIVIVKCWKLHQCIIEEIVKHNILVLDTTKTFQRRHVLFYKTMWGDSDPVFPFSSCLIYLKHHYNKI